MAVRAEVMHPLVRVTNLLMSTPSGWDVCLSWRGDCVIHLELSGICSCNILIYWLLKMRTLSTCDFYVDVLNSTCSNNCNSNVLAGKLRNLIN